ncbi:MAG: hypothetical protein J3K34DRAFT_459028 [Monoraphidium minutum]|nr:MAG: hypothetical protein J3K34DRAFT_459028 [Monoraphidium minutum]
MAEAPPATKLEALGTSLVARILEHLMPPDIRGGGDSDAEGDWAAGTRSRWPQCGAALAALRTARLASKSLDEAARLHLVHTVALTPQKAARATACAGVRRGPDWARFPALRALRLEKWSITELGSNEAHFPQERARVLAEAAAFDSLFALGQNTLSAGACGCLAAVTALDLRSSWVGTKQRMLALVARLPGLRALMVGVSALDGEHLAIAAPGLPGLEFLYAPGVKLGTAGAGATALARLPALRALDVQCVWEGNAWDLLPCSRLTRLGCFDMGLLDAHQIALPSSTPGPPRFPQLRELRGVCLTPDFVSFLARSAPRLQRLVCWAQSCEWQAGVAHGSLPSVTHACIEFEDCFESIVLAMDVRRLLPAVLDLVFQLDCDDLSCLPRIPNNPTTLRALALIDHDGDLAHVADWGGVPRLSGLTRLARAVDPRQLSCLSHLAGMTALQVLLLDICFRDYENTRVPVPVCALLEAAARVPRLHTLVITATDDFPNVEWDFGALARFTAAPSALRRLKLGGCLHPPLAVVGALAMHPQLRRLVVSCWSEDREEAEALAAQVYAAGLERAVCVSGEPLPDEAACGWWVP